MGLVSVLVGEAAHFVFSLSRIPQYTWPHSISATRSIALAVPVWQAGFIDGDPGMGRWLGGKGHSFRRFWNGKIVLHAVYDGYPNIPPLVYIFVVYLSLFSMPFIHCFIFPFLVSFGDDSSALY